MADPVQSTTPDDRIAILEAEVAALRARLAIVERATTQKHSPRPGDTLSRDWVEHG